MSSCCSCFLCCFYLAVRIQVYLMYVFDIICNNCCFAQCKQCAAAPSALEKQLSALPGCHSLNVRYKQRVKHVQNLKSTLTPALRSSRALLLPPGSGAPTSSTSSVLHTSEQQVAAAAEAANISNVAFDVMVSVDHREHFINQGS